MRVEDRNVSFIEIYDRMLNRISDTYFRYRVTSFCCTVKGIFELNYIPKITTILAIIIDVLKIILHVHRNNKIANEVYL